MVLNTVVKGQNLLVLDENSPNVIRIVKLLLVNPVLFAVERRTVQPTVVNTKRR